MYYTVRDQSFYFLPDDVAALCEGWVLYRLGKQSRTCKGVGGTVGGRGMFREKPRQLTDVGSTAEPRTPTLPTLPLARNRGKKCPQQQAYRHEPFRAGMAYVGF
jgi:hypothetical protein